MNIVLFITGIVIFVYVSKILWNIKSISTHSIKLNGKVVDGVAEVNYDGKVIYQKVSDYEKNDNIEIYINPNNGRLYTKSEFLNYNRYKRNTILLYLFDTILLLPPILIWSGLSQHIAFIGTFIFIIYLLLILLATKTLYINTYPLDGGQSNVEDYEKKSISKITLSMFDENIKNSKIIPLSFEKYESKYKLAKAFIISSSIIAFTIIVCMLMFESINIIFAIVLLLMIVSIIFLVSPKDEGFKQDIIIKKDSLLWFITHIDNKSNELYEWYDLYKINSVRKYYTDDKTFIIKGNIEKMTKRPGFHSKFVDASIYEIKIPRVFDEEEYILKKIDELIRESKK